MKRDPKAPGLWIGVYAARNSDALLSRIGKSSGVELSLEPPYRPTIDLVSSLKLPELPGYLGQRGTFVAAALVHGRAARSHGARDRPSATLASALLLTVLLARGPGAASSRPGRAGTTWDARRSTPVVATGARELVEAAEAFNGAIRTWSRCASVWP